MNPQGKILYVQEEEKEKINRGELLQVSEKDMTAKQKRDRQVNIKDRLSVLGKNLHSFRNKPCYCGSGKLRKDCCK